MKKKLDDLKNDLDLNKLFPGYFNKNIFRAFIIILVVFSVGVWASMDFKLYSAYLHCNSKDACPNPYYVCQEGELSLIDDCINYNEKIKPFCDVGACDKRFLLPGETLGEKPNSLQANQLNYVLGLLAFAFLTNHIYYMFWGRVNIDRD